MTSEGKREREGKRGRYGVEERGKGFRGGVGGENEDKHRGWRVEECVGGIGGLWGIGREGKGST